MTEDAIDLGYRKASRSAYAHETAVCLDIFLGHCDEHDRPVRHEGEPLGPAGRSGRYYIPCPVDTGPVLADRLVVTTTHITCDGACMSARRPICDCGCGGMNHGKSWGTTVTRQEFESALRKYQEEKQRIEVKRVQRAEARERKAAQDFEAWKTAHADLVKALEAHQPDELGYPQSGSNDFLCDLARRVHRHGKALSDKQIAAAERCLAREQARRAELAARKAAAKPCPEGRIQISGEIVKVKVREGYAYNQREYKAVVKCDGYAIWVTLPRLVMTWVHDSRRLPESSYTHSSREVDFDDISYRWTQALRGAQLSFTAQVTRSGEDESFGFAKRPTKVEFTPQEEG